MGNKKNLIHIYQVLIRPFEKCEKSHRDPDWNRTNIVEVEAPSFIR
jgi:hypothetical protein